MGKKYRYIQYIIDSLVNMKEEETNPNHGIDYILTNIVGGGGKWQWVIVFAMLPTTLTSVSLLLHMFTAYAPRFRCFIPGCDSNITNTIDTSYMKYATPKDYTSIEIVTQAEKFDPCHRYPTRNDDETCHETSFDNTTILECDRYVYDRSLFTETLASQFDLVSYGTNLETCFT